MLFLDAVPNRKKILYILMLLFYSCAVADVFFYHNSVLQDNHLYYVLSCVSEHIYMFSFVLILVIAYWNCKAKAMYVGAVYYFSDITFDAIFLFFFQMFVKENVYCQVSDYLFTLLYNLVVLLAIQKLKKKKKQISVLLNILPMYCYVLFFVALGLAYWLMTIQVLPTPSGYEQVWLEFRSTISKMTILSLVLLAFVLFAVLVKNTFRSVYYENISNLMERQLAQQVRYYQKTEEYDNRLRKFRHDYKNHMLCIQGLLRNEEWEKAKEYVSSLTEQEFYQTPFYHTGNKIADAILDDKKMLAAQSGAEIVFEGTITDAIPGMDMCVLLSNVIDNAIEECGKIEKATSAIENRKMKTIQIAAVYSQSVQKIQVSNPTLKPVKTKGHELRTTKKDVTNHGIGLINVEATLKKYHGNYTLSSTTDRFTITMAFQI